MKKIVLFALLTLGFTTPAMADELVRVKPTCSKETTRYNIGGAVAAQIVTNTTNVRVCRVELTCAGACTVYARKHAGGTITGLWSLGAAGNYVWNYNDVNGGGWPGLNLSLPGLYYDPATASTTKANIYYELR